MRPESAAGMDARAQPVPRLLALKPEQEASAGLRTCDPAGERRRAQDIILEKAPEISSVGVQGRGPMKRYSPAERILGR